MKYVMKIVSICALVIVPGFCLFLTQSVFGANENQTVMPKTAVPVVGTLGMWKPEKYDQKFKKLMLPEQYVRADGQKALIASPTGWLGWWRGARSRRDASRKGMNRCKSRGHSECFVLAEGDKIKVDIEELFLAKASYLDLGSDYDSVVLGDANAPITVIAYESFTCTDSRRFHTQVFDPIKEKYIDKGLVRYIFRDYTRNKVDVKASLMARCFPPGEFYRYAETLFQRHGDWAGKKNKWGDEKKLLKIAMELGKSEADLKKCLENKENETLIYSSRYEGKNFFNLMGTPTFVVNGYVFHGGFWTKGRFEKVLDGFLKDDGG